MSGFDDERFGGSNGEMALMQGLRSPPRFAGAHFGEEGFRICSWSTSVEEYQLPAVPEWIVALHTGGACVDRVGTGRSHGSRSLPGLGTIRPPGVRDTYRPRGPFRCTTAHIGTSKVRDVARAMGMAQPPESVPYRFGVQDALLRSILSALAREVESPAEHGSLLADRLIEGLVIAILRIPRPEPGSAKTPRLSPRVLARVCDRIDASLARPVTVADLAAEAGLSPFHFARAFKHSTGLTPHRYVTERRLERAKALLLEADLPICRVALESGFTSQQHFTGLFRDWAGTPPATFRRLNR